MLKQFANNTNDMQDIICCVTRKVDTVCNYELSVLSFNSLRVHF